MKNNKKRGFTIVELVIVIAVIAILAAVLIPTFSNVVENANKSAAIQEARNAWVATMADEADTGSVEKYQNVCIKTSKGYYVQITNGAVVTDKVSKTHSEVGTCKLSTAADTTVKHVAYEVKDGKIAPATSAHS